MTKAGALALAVVLVLTGALAGCFGKKDDPAPPTTNTSTGGGTTGGGTTGGSSGGTGSGGTNTTAPPPPPPNPVNETYSLALDPGAPAAKEYPFTVPATGYRTFQVTAQAQAAASPQPGTVPGVPFLADAIVVSVVDPAGTVVGTTEIPAGPPSGPVTIDVPAGGVQGAYLVRVQGKTAQVAGTVSGTISVTY